MYCVILLFEVYRNQIFFLILQYDLEQIINKIELLILS